MHVLSTYPNHQIPSNFITMAVKTVKFVVPGGNVWEQIHKKSPHCPCSTQHSMYGLPLPLPNTACMAYLCLYTASMLHPLGATLHIIHTLYPLHLCNRKQTPFIQNLVLANRKPHNNEWYKCNLTLTFCNLG